MIWGRTTNDVETNLRGLGFVRASCNHVRNLPPHAPVLLSDVSETSYVGVQPLIFESKRLQRSAAIVVAVPENFLLGKAWPFQPNTLTHVVINDSFG